MRRILRYAAPALIAAAIWVAAACSGMFKVNEGDPTPVSVTAIGEAVSAIPDGAEGYIHVSAEELSKSAMLYKDFYIHSNSIGIEWEYEGKRVMVSGVVETVTKTAIDLGGFDDYRAYPIAAFVNEGMFPDIESIQPGDEIMVCGVASFGIISENIRDAKIYAEFWEVGAA